ncbi:hypothetical protein BC939DRAFT_254790 [Gamsiella multidivaricata]|uniref:uncharacterized protein n=1 Tax=Gamsiella multidivaricata TaxID=101098 RepID=UPI00222000B9|nr:uncharacterized protein BC939DRAFT_254790 [Gamsiella multidivaricata]KAI7819646.1 hypothetical protein BC939DRAFT_254790 [Gamsiella multidivaricata]
MDGRGEGCFEWSDDSGSRQECSLAAAARLPAISGETDTTAVCARGGGEIDGGMEEVQCMHAQMRFVTVVTSNPCRRWQSVDLTPELPRPNLVCTTTRPTPFATLSSPIPAAPPLGAGRAQEATAPCRCYLFTPAPQCLAPVEEARRISRDRLWPPAYPMEPCRQLLPI